MVVFLELDDDGNPAIATPLDARLRDLGVHDTPAQSAGLVRATACYPIVSELARSLDLTSLDCLSQSCKQIRENLLQHKHSLMTKALRCANDNAASPRARCARDMVSGCHRCGTVVCRNCIAKPNHRSLSHRHRRLCRTCVKAPVAEHLVWATDTSDSSDGDSMDWASEDCLHESSPRAVFHGPCRCAEEIWFCEPCAKSQRSEDVKYMRGWTWRRRYSHTGIGIGEGEQGVPCGRGKICLAVREVEVEIDADYSGLRLEQTQAAILQLPGHGMRDWSNTSYRTQEIEGIGGVVKKKVKRRVAVGHVVKEYEDEREHGEYLRREQSGQVRSWCAHCERVILGKKDAVSEAHEVLDRVTSATDSTTSSSN